MVPFEYFKLTAKGEEGYDYEFKVSNVYVDYDRDMVNFTLEAVSPAAKFGMIETPAGCDRPQIGKYTEKGLTFRIVGHTEIAEDYWEEQKNKDPDEL